MVTTASIAFLLFGYDQGVMGSLLTLPSFYTTFLEMDTTTTTGDQRLVNSRVQGAAVAIYEVGGAIGALASLFFGDRIGRLRMIWLGHMIIIIGAILQCSSYSLRQFIVARIITGVGIGFNTATIPIWQSESSRSHKRGKYMMIEGAMITGGVCLSYWMNYGFHYLPSSLSWRFPIAFQMVFAIVICLVVLDLPESPRWLIKKGRLEEGKKVIDRIYGDASSEIKQADFDEVCTEISATQGTSWRSLIDNSTQTRNLHRFILGLTHSIFHQICGINLVIYYAPKIYQESLGLTADQTRIVSACVNGTAYFFTSFIATGLIERMGRRKLMFIGTAGQGLGMSALAGCSAYSYIPSAAAAAAAMIFFIQASFAIGWLAIAWLYPAEIVPTQIRAQANGIIVAVTWLFNFFVVQVTPIALANIAYRTYIIFAVLNALIFICLYLFFPETAYRSLEEIDEIFAQSKSIWDVVKVSHALPHRHGAYGEVEALGTDSQELAELKLRNQLQHVENSVDKPAV